MKQTMGEFLATLRKANGYTQQYVAEKLGVSNRTLSSWETDRTAPDLLILPALADLYGVTVDEILRGERRAAERSDLSDGALRELTKRRYVKYCTRRYLCFGFALLGSLIFLAACAVMLYSSAPLWLSVLLMVIGAGGCVACVILIACFAYSAIRAEGLVLKEDFTEKKKPYALCVRRGVANSFLWLSLPHILGAIVFLIVFFAAGYDNYEIISGGISVRIDYTTPTVTLVCLNAAFALAFFIAGMVLNHTGIKSYGSEVQRARIKANRKLRFKIVGFGAIPVAAALIALIVCLSVTPVYKTIKTYFEAQSAEEVLQIFQTYETGDITQEAEDGKKVTLVPAGKYYLNFQSENSVLLKSSVGEYADTFRFYDLGNGFYGENYYARWHLYHLNNGVTAEDIVPEEVYYNYLTRIDSFDAMVSLPEAEGKWAVIVADYPVGNIWVESAVVGLDVSGYYELNYRDGVYRYEEIYLYDFSGLAAVVFWSVFSGTVTAGAISYFVKREKRTEYTF